MRMRVLHTGKLELGGIAKLAYRVLPYKAEVAIEQTSNPSLMPCRWVAPWQVLPAIILDLANRWQHLDILNVLPVIVVTLSARRKLARLICGGAYS